MGCLSGCAVSVVRLILFVFNFLIFACAICLVTFGGIIQYNNVGYDVSKITIFAIVVGCVIGLIAFLGCCGAWNGNSCLLTSYAAILIVLFILQIILGIVIFVAIQKSDDNVEEDFKQELRDQLEKLYHDYLRDNDSKIIIDDLQQRYECCGINGASGSEVIINGNTIIPSCCSSFDSSKDAACQRSQAYGQGCLNVLYDFLEMLASVAGGIAIGFGVVELVAAIFAFCVRNHYNEKRHATY